MAHVGTTVSGTIGAQNVISLEEAVERVHTMAEAAREVAPDVPVICHGGPIAGVEDTRYVLDRALRLAGFYGASSMERLPVELAITENVRRFKGLTLKP